MLIKQQVKCSATILQFAEKGEKTGWTYIRVSQDIAQLLKPGNKKTFRVKGKLDDYSIRQVALMPMGDGSFILPLNATMRKGICKKKGSMVLAILSADDELPTPPAEFIECLEDEPGAFVFFKQLTNGHQNYFSNWIRSAKTEPVKIKRIAEAVAALAKGLGFAEMLRAKKGRNDLYLP